MSARVVGDDALDDLYRVDRLLNAAALACFAMKGNDTDAVSEVIETARGVVKIAMTRLQDMPGSREVQGKQHGRH